MTRLLVRGLALGAIAGTWALAAHYYAELEQVLRQAAAWIH